MAVLVGAMAWFAPGVLAGHPVTTSLSWLPAFGILRCSARSWPMI
jgi:hypothetical protein